MLSILEFKTEYPTGKEPRDLVLLAPKGEGHLKTQTWHQISKLIPPRTEDVSVRESATYQDMEAKWSVIGPAYDAWKKNTELPLDGTPLAAWSGVSRDLAGALAAMGIKTVEDVRDMGDGAISKLAFPNVRKLPELAKQYLDGKDLAARDQENADLKERLATMEEMLAEALAKDEPKKRGRPPKEKVEAA